MSEIQKRKGGRLTEEYLRSRYPHIVEGSMRWNPVAGKQQVTIQCTHEGCENTREVFTSDLFQVAMCPDHAKAARKARKAALKAQAKSEAEQVAEVVTG